MNPLSNSCQILQGSRNLRSIMFLQILWKYIARQRGETQINASAPSPRAKPLSIESTNYLCHSLSELKISTLQFAPAHPKTHFSSSLSLMKTCLFSRTRANIVYHYFQFSDLFPFNCCKILISSEHLYQTFVNHITHSGKNWKGLRIKDLSLLLTKSDSGLLSGSDTSPTINFFSSS